MKGKIVADKEPAEKSQKRRLKAPAETVREKQTSAQTKATKSNGRIRRTLRPLGWPFRKIAGLSFWQTKFWKPFRFVGKWVGLVLVPPYVRNSFRELKLVTWPDWKQTWRLTFAVLAFSLVFGAVIAGIDYGLDKLFKEVLLK
jgi:preprotein translocase SecE subunit